MSIIAYLNEDGRIVDVRRSAPLPVEVRNNEGSPLPTEPNSLDTLLYGANLNPTQAASASPSNTDLLANTDPETPTIVRAEAYRRFLLTGWRSSTSNSTSLTVDLYARSSDPNGAPLHISGTGVWFLIGSFATTATTSAEYFRLVLEPADGKPPGFDQYRVCIRKSTADSITVNLVLRGER